MLWLLKLHVPILQAKTPQLRQVHTCCMHGEMHGGSIAVHHFVLQCMNASTPNYTKGFQVKTVGLC